MAKFTPAYLKKLEELLKEQTYEVRYEKGNFRSNYCLLEAKRVVVINKFSTLESRIQALIEIITTLNANNQIQVDLRDIGLKNPIVSKEESMELDFATNTEEALVPPAENTENE
ncbi:MAG: hypothetical protein ACK44N_06385 [Bacteroidota bacterium]|jgi:predicted nucleic-acid-binding protein